MNKNDVLLLLKLRRELTNDSFSEATIAAWTLALGQWPYASAREALIVAAREKHRVAIADMTAHLPGLDRRPGGPPVEACARCDGSGWEVVSEGHADTVKPCACTKGKARQPAFDKAVKDNAAMLRRP